MLNMKPAWETFFENAVRAVFASGNRILDIGGGLRVDGSRGNVVDPSRTWIKSLLEKVTYHVLDPVDTYHPDIVADVMSMPSVPDASYDAVICMAVLEHVPRPWDAVREMKRVLKPGGLLLLYVPFLSPYHAMPGYYGDYVRFTGDGLRALCDGFEDVRVQPVRGLAETIVHLLPRPLNGKLLKSIARFVDGLRSQSGNQTSGYNVIARKPA